MFYEINGFNNGKNYVNVHICASHRRVFCDICDFRTAYTILHSYATAGRKVCVITVFFFFFVKFSFSDLNNKLERKTFSKRHFSISISHRQTNS